MTAAAGRAGAGTATALRVGGFAAAGRRATVFLVAGLASVLAEVGAFLAGRATFRTRLATFCVRFRVRDAAAARRAAARGTAFRAGRRRRLAAPFGRVFSDFFDFLDFAGPVARLGLAARRPAARFAFALAMTLLMRARPGRRGRRRWDVVRLV
jgi:hypothetical protein